MRGRLARQLDDDEGEHNSLLCLSEACMLIAAVDTHDIRRERGKTCGVTDVRGEEEGDDEGDGRERVHRGRLDECLDDATIVEEIEPGAAVPLPVGLYLMRRAQDAVHDECYEERAQRRMHGPIGERETY